MLDFIYSVSMQFISLMTKYLYCILTMQQGAFVRDFWTIVAVHSVVTTFEFCILFKITYSDSLLHYLVASGVMAVCLEEYAIEAQEEWGEAYVLSGFMVASALSEDGVRVIAFPYFADPAVQEVAMDGQILV